MSNEQVFDSKNELEEQLLAAQQGHVSGEDFMHQLMVSQLFMPVEEKSGIQSFQESTKAKPLSVQAEDGTDALILFTSPERAKSFVQDFLGYEAGLLAEFKWILERMGVGCGIVINPGWAVGLDMEPNMVKGLLEEAGGNLQ